MIYSSNVAGEADYDQELPFQSWKIRGSPTSQDIFLQLLQEVANFVVQFFDLQVAKLRHINFQQE